MPTWTSSNVPEALESTMFNISVRLLEGGCDNLAVIVVIPIGGFANFRSIFPTFGRDIEGEVPMPESLQEMDANSSVSAQITCTVFIKMPLSFYAFQPVVPCCVFLTCLGLFHPTTVESGIRLSDATRLSVPNTVR
jgi:hypothetical protein